ncbi:MAG TPA: haloacid dehalogenase-like hydrolase [Gaiellaceae bacterium]|nr:haloacid dehalogenase-like hydrolase [Gaiellaceae bacterium]
MRAGDAVTLSPGRCRLRFRDALRRTAGSEVIFWPDGSRGRVDAVVVGPYEFWPEALVVARDGGLLRLPAANIHEIDPQQRLVLASLPAAPPRPGARRPTAAFLAVDRSLEVGSRRLAQLAPSRGAQPRPAALAGVLEAGLRRRLDGELLELAARHRARGERVYLVSSYPEPVTQALAERLGLDGGLAPSALPVDAGRLRRLAGAQAGAAKADAVRRLAASDCLDLGASTAYADDATDRELLGAVGHPVALNPDRALRQLALARGWPLLERVGG